MCERDRKPTPRGGRTKKERDLLEKRGAWFRRLLDPDQHAPGCRWAQLLRRVS